VVVFAHGYRDGVGPYARIAGLLAAQGYLVAAPSFPLTDETRAGQDLDEADIDHEAADLSFVLTQLLADPELGPVADATRIGAAGHSDGASVAVQLAYGPTGKDHRVRAVVALTAGSPGPGALSGPPMLLEQSDTDQYNDLSIAQELLDQVTTPWWFVLLHGATHSGPVEGDATYTGYLDAVVLAFLDRYLKGVSDAPPFEDVARSRPDLATVTTG
jgi:dienelactone hydrolase